MATRGLLEIRHLTMLWEATLGKHESVKHVIYTALLELLTCLSSKDIDFLYELINNLPPADCDSESLNFIHNFTISAIVSPLNSEVSSLS
jgi:hypothetical protein